MKRIYDERRRYMLGRLRGMGLSIPHEPTGAFYVLVDFRHVSGDSLALAFDILEKAHVGVTPGIDFGPGAEGYLRFSYASSLGKHRRGHGPSGAVSGEPLIPPDPKPQGRKTRTSRSGPVIFEAHFNLRGRPWGFSRTMRMALPISHKISSSGVRPGKLDRSALAV